MLEILIVSIILIMVAFALFGVRLLFIKNSEFRGTCASNSSFLNKEGITCGVCGAKPGESCAKDDKDKSISQSPA